MVATELPCRNAAPDPIAMLSDGNCKAVEHKLRSTDLASSELADLHNFGCGPDGAELEGSLEGSPSDNTLASAGDVA